MGQLTKRLSQPPAPGSDTAKGTSSWDRQGGFTGTGGRERSSTQEGTLPAHRKRSTGSPKLLFVPDCSLPHPSVNPLPSAGRVKTDGCFLKGMHKLTQKPNSSPPHPTAHPCEQHNGARKAPAWEGRCHRRCCRPALSARQSRADLGLGAACPDTTAHLPPPQPRSRSGGRVARRCPSTKAPVGGWRSGIRSKRRRSRCWDRAARNRTALRRAWTPILHTALSDVPEG